MNRIKQIIRTLLALFGLTITRQSRQSSDTEIAYGDVKVGKFQIRMRHNTDLSRAYVANAHYGSLLGRLAAVAYQKYPNFHVIDVGANVGDTLAIIKSVIDVPVLCIEGDPEAFALLQQNVAQFNAVTLQKMFLGETTTVIAATLNKQGWNGTILPQATATEDSQAMQIMSLDDLLKDDPNIRNYRLFKVDAEGFDCPIIRGSKQLLQRVKPILCLEYNRENMQPLQENGLDTLWMLADLGYNVVVVYDPQARFLLSTTLDNKKIIEDLHYYADGRNSAIHYYDLCIFHQEDDDIALEFAKSERNLVAQPS